MLHNKNMLYFIQRKVLIIFTAKCSSIFSFVHRKVKNYQKNDSISDPSSVTEHSVYLYYSKKLFECKHCNSVRGGFYY